MCPSGKTPPCVDALIAARVARIVVALGDPDRRVNGRGLDKAKSAGIHVDLGVEAAAAGAVLNGFLQRITHGRPVVWLKTAASLDGAIALADGQKRWLTGEPMRHVVHELRSRCDALLSGVGTILADDPEFTCRAPSLTADSPALYILDSQLRTPTSARLYGNKIRSAVFRPLYKQFYWILVVDVLVLGYVGAMPAEGLYLLIARVDTVYYFVHFLLILPILGFKEKTIPLPLSITEPILGGAPMATAVKKKESID